MNKREVKECNHVSIDKFLRDYVGVDNDEHIAYLSSLTHKKLKLECRRLTNVSLVPMSFDDIDAYDVAVGDVLLVCDAKHRLGAYLNIYDVVLEESKPFTGPFYDPVMSYDEYVDEIEEHFLDEGFSNAKIKSIGFYRKK